MTPGSTLHTESLQLEVTDDSYDGESAQETLERGQRGAKEEVGLKEPTRSSVSWALSPS